MIVTSRPPTPIPHPSAGRSEARGGATGKRPCGARRGTNDEGRRCELGIGRSRGAAGEASSSTYSGAVLRARGLYVCSLFIGASEASAASYESK
jgi:hypothetical protein